MCVVDTHEQVAIALVHAVKQTVSPSGRFQDVDKWRTVCTT